MVPLLNKAAPEGTLTTLFQSLKQIPDLKNLADAKQKYQLKHWLGRDLNRGAVENIILRVPQKLKQHILEDYTTMYLAKKNVASAAVR